MTEFPPIRVILADDHKMLREALRALLESEAGFEVLAEAADGASAARLALELAPDVIVMDIRMPGLDGIEATRRVVAANTGAKVIALSAHADERIAGEALRAGAAGYLSKDVAFEELAAAVRTVCRGDVYLSPRIGRKLLREGIDRAPASAAAYETLSVRERQVLQLLAEGKATKEVAALLQVSVKTAETHRRSLMQKLAIDNVADLTRYAIREGLTSAEV